MSKLKFKITAKIVNLDAESWATFTVFIPKQFSLGSAALNQQSSSTEVCTNQAILRFLKTNKIVSTYPSEFVWYIPPLGCSVITNASLGATS